MNQELGPVWLLKPPPPPTQAKDVNVFHYNLLFFFVVLNVSSVMTSSWHFSTSGFNIRFARTPPIIKKKLLTNFHQITSIFYMLLEDSFGVKFISKFSWGLEAYIKNVYEFCWPMYTDLGRPGDTFNISMFIHYKITSIQLITLYVITQALEILKTCRNNLTLSYSREPVPTFSEKDASFRARYKCMPEDQ